MSNYSPHNPLYNFCEKIHNRCRSIAWTDESYTEMIGRLCYLIDNGQSIHRSVIGPFSEKFDEFRESYASFLKTLDEAGIKYNVEYGIVKYYY